MEKITVLQENNDQELVANHSPESAFNVKLRECFNNSISLCTIELSLVRGQAFLSSFKKKYRDYHLSTSSVDGEIELD